MLKNVDDGSLKIVLRCGGPLSSNLEVAIVDAAVIHGAKSFRASVLGNKDRGFRRNFGVGDGNELVMRVEQDMALRAIGCFMPADSFGSLSDVGIDEPEHYMLRGEFAFDALHLRKVTI